MKALARCLLLAPLLAAAAPPLLPPGQGEAIGAELSGSAALRTVRTLSQHHRMRGSDGYRAAAEAIRDRLRDYGLEGVEILSLPADGRIFYGTQRSRPGWNARFAELWEGQERIASWADQPISLAQDSVSGRAEADLVDVGAGTVGERLSGQGRARAARPHLLAARRGPGAGGRALRRGGDRLLGAEPAHRLVGRGREPGPLGPSRHLRRASRPSPSWSRRRAPMRWQERLRRGEAVHLRAEVDAGQAPSAYLIPTAIIPGRDRAHEIVFSCHLDHPSPGANDNACGCAGELEIARTLHRLVASGALPRPERTIRFLWPAEMEGTIALLNARPEFARRALATIHLDMIGGNTEITKSILRVHGSPPSLPSFVSDVGFAFARYVNAQSMAYADTGAADMPLVDPEGDRRALQAEIGGFNEGSDHQVWAEGSWRVPVIYIADWPDRYIHTQRDLPDNLDPTKMRRAMFIAAASGWYLANYPARRAALSAAVAIRAGSSARRRPCAAAMRAAAGDADSAALAPLPGVRAAAVIDFVRTLRADCPRPRGASSTASRRCVRPGRAVRARSIAASAARGRWTGSATAGSTTISPGRICRARGCSRASPTGRARRSAMRR